MKDSPKTAVNVSPELDPGLEIGGFPEIVVNQGSQEANFEVKAGNRKINGADLGGQGIFPRQRLAEI